MAKRNIVVIGASAGGFNELKKLAANLPANLDAAIFIVWHISPEIRGILPQVLDKLGPLPANHALDKEPIRMGNIYVAPPDHHLILTDSEMRLSRGPKENRFRPAIDPLFRSAADAFGSRVIGIILSGALDDGSAGLWAIKQCGGITIVQDPEEAAVSSMPKNALRTVQVDYKCSVDDMPAILSEICKEELNPQNSVDMKENEKIKAEVSIALEDEDSRKKWLQLGTLTPYTCPECHGVLASLQEGDRVRFRCHTGHAFSADSLLTAITENIEESLWAAIRSVQESVFFLNHMGDHFAEQNQPKLAAMYFRKAHDADQRAGIIRSAVFNHEQLSTLGVEQQAKESNINMK